MKLSGKELYREKNKYLAETYEEVQPMDFYRDIFPVGSFERMGHQEDKKANGILRDLSGEMPRTYIVTDELDAIRKLQGSQMAVMSCISYSGKTNKAINACWMYALIIDVDYLTEMTHLTALHSQIEHNVIPRPTYVVNSGNGVHLYYVFSAPVPMYQKLQGAIRELKYQIIERVWNRYTSSKGERENKQRQGIMQAFRIVGSQSKLGADCPVKAFKTGKKITMDDLNQYVYPEYRVESFDYKSNMTLEEAKKKYPEWYERRIIRGEKKGSWTVKRNLYDWWLWRIKNEASVGHRYYCTMCLAIYARKCGISYEELEKDAYSLLENFNIMREAKDSPFTKMDIEDALGLYNEPYETYPRSEIERVSGISLPKNKRNGRRQSLHLRLARSNLAIMSEDRGKALQGRPIGSKDKISRNSGGGRPVGAKDKRKRADGCGRSSAQSVVKQWQMEHPQGKKVECVRQLGLSKPTVYKWWNEGK